MIKKTNDYNDDNDEDLRIKENYVNDRMEYGVISDNDNDKEMFDDDEKKY